MDQEILELLKTEAKRAFHLSEILKHLGGSSKKEKLIKRVLKTMVRRGAIERTRGRAYRMSKVGEQIVGRVQVDAKKRMVFIPKDARFAREPFPIVEDDVDGLRPGDEVKAEIVVRGRRGTRFARLVEIEDRAHARHVGVYRRVGKASVVEVQLDRSAGFKQPLTSIHVDDSKTKVQNGDLVEVSLSFDPSKKKSGASGKIVKVLGAPGERATEMQRLLIEHQLDRPFPDAVTAEAEAFGDVPTDADIKGRRDVRDIPLVTIDGVTAKDFDDAVAAVRDDDDGYRLYVAVADVSHYVRVGGPLDDEAIYRATSTYLTDRAIPMLPEALSNGLCSLNPQVDRLCMLAELHVDRLGHVTEAKFERAVMRSKARLTYAQVARSLEGEPDEACMPVLSTLLLLSRISSKLLERRLRRGAIDLDLPEPYIVFDPDGEPVSARRRARTDAHRLIEELMLATNEAVARFFAERDIPTIFRIHEEPDRDKLDAFASLGEHLGVRVHLSERPAPGEVAQLLEKVSSHERGKALHGVLLRSLKQARYAPNNEGHYGLASDAYLHFTSPIRRYPDLVVHRLLKRLIDGNQAAYSFQDLERIAGECSDKERKAMTAERDSMDLDRALVARTRLGERFTATINGLQTFGLFASIEYPYVEGFVPVQSLPDDFYEMDEYGMALIGQRSGRRFQLGEEIEVEIAVANLQRRKVEFRLVGVPARGPGQFSRRPTPRAEPQRRDKNRSKGRDKKPERKPSKKRRSKR